MSNHKIHFVRGNPSKSTACNLNNLPDNRVTNDFEKVTCFKCIHSLDMAYHLQEEVRKLIDVFELNVNKNIRLTKINKVLRNTVRAWKNLIEEELNE